MNNTPGMPWNFTLGGGRKYVDKDGKFYMVEWKHYADSRLNTEAWTEVDRPGPAVDIDINWTQTPC